MVPKQNPSGVNLGSASVLERNTNTNHSLKTVGLCRAWHNYPKVSRNLPIDFGKKEKVVVSRARQKMV